MYYVSAVWGFKTDTIFNLCTSDWADIVNVGLDLCRAMPCHRYATGYVYHCWDSGWKSKRLWVKPL